MRVADRGYRVGAADHQRVPMILKSPLLSSLWPRNAIRGVIDMWRWQWRGWRLGVLLLMALVFIRATLPAAASLEVGPGGPVLLITDPQRPWSGYYAELLRTEGLNAFTSVSVASLDASVLATHQTVVLPRVSLSDAQVSLLGQWVQAGGLLLAMAPDDRLLPLLGLAPTGQVLQEGYMRINVDNPAARGLNNQTLQYHGQSALWRLQGAQAVAWLYADALSATSSPAVSWRAVGAGQAAAFSYDLASSIVMTRQGNPAWAAQERDGLQPIRSNDKFFGASATDPRADWVDAQRIEIPQADEQLRLFSQLIVWMNQPRQPIARFWYLPHGHKAAVVMTGDDHGNNGTAARFDQLLAASPAGCSVPDWQCVRGTSYLYPGTPLATHQALAYESQGFEVGLHINTGCANYSLESLEVAYQQQLQEWSRQFSTLLPPSTQRHHCVVWSDWTSGAEVQSRFGMRLDTTYYHWPPTWVNRRAGVFTGSALPMRFASTQGRMVDVFQVPTQMTDESGQPYPQTVEALLDRALGPQGYYGVYTVNAHTDQAISLVADAVVATAKSRQVPVVSARQMLSWLDARNASTWTPLSWDGRTWRFDVQAAAAARGLRAMLPKTVAGRTLTSLQREGVAVPTSIFTVKGVDYVFFPATSGRHEAVYTDSSGVGSDGCPCSAWPSASTPTTASFADPLPVELGVKFRSDRDGWISGVRFYKGSGNVGVHRGSLWSVNGQLLASAVFQAESASGWQEVRFAQPVPIVANTVYVASYFAPMGAYAVDTGFFSTTGVDRTPIRLLRDGESGPNGVYAYSSVSTFPSQSWRSSNYWVDVVFETTISTPPPPPPPTDACASPANPVVAENCLPGTPASQWDISGIGDPGLQGFATEMSVQRGQTIEFKVDTRASSYRIELYRLGYYQGLGARRVDTVQPHVTLPQIQPACLQQADVGLVDCGNWRVSARWTVPTTAVSGVYLARLVRPDTGGASHVLFVVRDGASAADVVFQTSDTTWQAYNTYGGASLYSGGPAGCAYKVSYNRPLHTRAVDGGQDSFFNAEVAMLRWLEANGYHVTYQSGVDTHRYGVGPRQHRVFVSVGHDEYWSGTQRANVEAARAAGMHLAFFSGNEMFWKTRWEASIDGTSSPMRTLVTYKETHANAKIDPSPEWTGTWRDPRFSPPYDGGRPENGLTGTWFVVNDGATGSIRIPSDLGALRFWRHTDMAQLNPNASAVLPWGTLGYEWNVDADNAHRPPGLIRLSDTEVADAPVLQDWGSTYGRGTARHAITLYRHASGALVFSAGTVQWSWGLDAQHDRAGTPVDRRMQQATMNLLADMVVMPATPSAGLVRPSSSADRQAPTSSVTLPLATSVLSVGVPVTVQGVAFDAGGGRVGGVEVSIDGGLTWRPAQGLENWRYTFTPSAAALTSGRIALRTRAVDDSGWLESPGPGRDWPVVNAACPCSLWAADRVPAITASADTAAVNLGVRFTSSVSGSIAAIRFYKGAGNDGPHPVALWSATGQLLASAEWPASAATGWQQVNLASPVPIQAGQTYVASYLAPRGRYAAEYERFSGSSVQRGPLTAAADGSGGGNGVYRYGSSLAFPQSSYRASDYGVDVVLISP